MFGGALGMLVGGKTKKNSSRKHRSRRMKGGHLPLSPFTLAEGDIGSVPRGIANYEESPLTVPSSTMVGGGYGFGMDSAGDVPSFAGSYFPVSKVCTAGTPDNNSRGGNNFGQGGGGSPSPLAPLALSGGGRKKRRGGSKKRRTMKKWRQRGCNRKGGSKKKSKGKRRH